MRRFSMLIIFIFISFTLYSQNKIPRRVVYELKISKNMTKALSVLPTVLNAEINKIQTIIPVEKISRHHNTISIVVTKDQYLFQLLDNRGLIDEINFTTSKNDNLEVIKQICNKVAYSWEKYLKQNRTIYRRYRTSKN